MSSEDKIEGQGSGGKGPRFPLVKDFEMRIARDGTWYHQGDPIKRIALVKLFATVLKRDEEGLFWLETPVEKGRIEVEDAPFVAVELQEEGEGRQQVLRFRTNLDEWVEAGPDHPIRVEQDRETGEPSPYIGVKAGPAGGLEALIARPVFYRLVELAESREEEGEEILGLWSHGQFFTLGRTRS